MKKSLIIAALSTTLVTTGALAAAVPHDSKSLDAAIAPPAAMAAKTAASAADVGATDQTDTIEAELKALKVQVQALIAETRAGATTLVRQIPGTCTLSQEQIAGIALGVVTGAVVADVLGGGGLVTVAVAAGGGILGSWIGEQL